MPNISVKNTLFHREQSCLKYLLLPIALMFYPLAATVRAEAPPTTISAYGDDYLSACISTETDKLKTTVLKLAAGRKADLAWKLTHVLLCEHSESAENYAWLHMPARIIATTSNTSDKNPGNPPRLLIARTTEVIQKGFAWGADAKSVGEKIAINFLIAEVCGATFTLKYASDDWLLVEVGSVCD